MKIIKKIDDLGRICIPKELRRSLRWMGGDEIEISLTDDGNIQLHKHEDNIIPALEAFRAEWRRDPEVDSYFIDLIEAIKEKTK